MKIEPKRTKRFSDEEIIQFLNQVSAASETTAQPLLDKLSYDYDFSKDDFEKWREQYGNKLSGNLGSRDFGSSKPYIQANLLANELHLPLESILHFASEGLIPIFTLFSQRHVSLVFIQRDFIAPLGLKLPESVMSLANLSKIGASPLASQDTIGLFLNNQDCRDLLKEGRVRQGLFPASLMCRFDRYTVERADHPGYLPQHHYPGVDQNGWRVACYPTETALVFDQNTGYSPPIILKIALPSLYILGEHIEAFCNIIDSEMFLIDDLLVPPTKKSSIDDWNTFHVIDDKPSYISAKLTHLIETSEKFWSRKPSDGSVDYSLRRAKVREALGKTDFLDNFKMAKGKVSMGVLEAASRFIEPLYARTMSNEGRRSGHTYLSPELLIFLAASKLFWSSPHIDFGNPATHPSNADIESYLCIRGIAGNDADYAITLIRPEQASYGAHKPFISLNDRYSLLSPKSVLKS